MCKAEDPPVLGPSYTVEFAHQRLDQVKSAFGWVAKGKGGKPKSVCDKGVQADVRLPSPQKRLLLPSLAVLTLALVLNQIGLFVPAVMIIRNCVLPKKPQEIRPKYPSCPASMMAEEMTIVVSVKDACSQAPGFIRALELFAPPEVHLIYSFPNFESCASIDLKGVLKRWEKVTLLPLSVRSSPMQGWVDAVPHIKTKYSILLHNDGYALDSFFGCELLQSLKYHQLNDPNNNWVVAAPMLYESKYDGSLAAHATQTNLRLVQDDSPQGMTVHHDHSLRRALNRGNDFVEGEQSEFIEDHAFLIQTDKITTVIDPAASFTLEYLDMIMTIRANNWKVLFVPTARLEFRVTEFSWRDIPYFMYKRSEATCQGTRDYLKAKWQANFPNTGFWTYIKYTIVEQHVYRDVLADMKWKDQALLVFGFFQMAGYNRYHLSGAHNHDGRVDFLDVLQKIDRGWKPSEKLSIRASRTLPRPIITKTKPAYVKHLSEILPWGNAGELGGIKAEIEHEYLPFSLAKLTLGSCEQMTPAVEAVCGVVIEHESSCVCWINLPTFKSNSLFIRTLGKFAAMVKVPSRVTTFVEMAFAGSRNGTLHVEPLRSLEGQSFSLVTCDVDEADCATTFSFSKKSKLVMFRGAPSTIPDVLTALNSLE